MSNWVTKKLGDVCDISIGGTPSRSNPAYWDANEFTDNHWVSIRDLNQRTIYETAERLTNLGVKNSNAKLVSKGTLLLSFKLTIGRVAFAGNDLYTNEAIAALPTSSIDNDFLYYGLQHWDLLAGVDQAIKGATLNKAKLKEIEITFPKCHNEQTQIAAVLSCIDRAIEHTEALIAKQQRIKTGLMQDLLTKGIDEHGNIRSEVTHEFKDARFKGYKIPVEWNRLTMKDVCIVRQGFQIAISKRFREYAPNRFTYITIQYLKEPSRYLEFIENPPPSVVCKEDDILFTRTGNTGQIITGVHGVYHNNFFKIFYDHKLIIRDYLINFLQWQPIHSLILDLSGTTTIPDLKHKDFYSIPLFLPETIKEQEKITSCLAQSNRTLLIGQQQLDKLKFIKTGLMQDLLTGKVSVESLLAESGAVFNERLER